MRSEISISTDKPQFSQEELRPRPARVVMSTTRAKAACPNALSFSRSLVRKMVRERWRIERAKLELDSEGRGEGLYRIFAGDRHFHFFAISNVFPPDQKIDRSYGINWDVSAAIVQGSWTPDREAMLRDEIPKQYSGRYDADTLCFCRGNRSERLFDHVVDSLGQGQQPDAGLLASVGYILRSTAFAGNGLFGIKPFEGLGPIHPLGMPYHAQILAAYMLREFVFDLVDGMASARSPAAAKLDRRLKRYLGIGNSAGLGLIPFIANHPQIVHRWCMTSELALASARQRIPSGATANAFTRLLDKARQYFEQDPRDGNGIFANYAQLASEIEAVREQMATLFSGDLDVAGRSWKMLLEQLELKIHAETTEIVGSLLLELYPDIIENFKSEFCATETLRVDPTMTVGALRKIIHSAYDWLLPAQLRSHIDSSHFWYYPAEAPDEPRRGRRGLAPEFEFESKMDLPLKLGELVETLARYPESFPVASLLANHPDLRAVVSRIQTTGSMPYSELRENFLAASFAPFGACRFVLAFYGMEKYDPRPPRSTKGSLLQGAPIAEEIARGLDGDWPFPLAPELAGMNVQHLVSEFVPQRTIESPEISAKRVQELAKVKRTLVRTGGATSFPLEYRRLLTKALLSSGYSLGNAEFIARAAEFAETLGEHPLTSLVDQIATVPLRSETSINDESDPIDAGGMPGFGVAATALDLARARAIASPRNIGFVGIRNAKTSSLLFATTYLATQRNINILSDWMTGSLYVASDQTPEQWLMRISCGGPEAIMDMLSRGQLIPSPRVHLEMGQGADFTVCCLAAENLRIDPTALADAVRPIAIATATLWRAETINQLRKKVDQNGFDIPRELFEKLVALAKRTLVPEAIERKIAAPG